MEFNNSCSQQSFIGNRDNQKLEAICAKLIIDKIDQSDLDKNFRNKCKHPESQNLTENPIVSRAIWLRELIKENSKKRKGGWWFSKTIEERQYEELYEKYPEPYYIGNEIFRDTEKNDWLEPHIGWKFHINVAVNNCLIVSNWLKEKKFYHKLLNGGELEEGKIFTIYIGSYNLAKKLAQEIHQGVGKLISKPVDKNELEFKPGIIGRFDYCYDHSKAYGTCGFSLNPDYKSLPIKEQELRSYRDLKCKFGKYFYE